MALQFVPLPPAVRETYVKSLLDFMGEQVPEVHFYHLPVFALGLEDLQEGTTMAEARPSGCRIIAAWPDGSVTSCEMTEAALYGDAEFRNFVIGDTVATVYSRITEAQGLDAMQTG